ncbi:MAG TPA: alpha-L-fucosidase [Bryobacteraceae bacterium]|nr:alpha-L-fucosidase [Bryobacteraceae bacterium]
MDWKKTNPLSRRLLLQAAAGTALTRPAFPAPSRLDWWIDARFGMFIHWGVHTIIARDIWNMEHEAILPDEYRPLGAKFRPPVGVARQWARLAKKAGQKYMVLTTKNHDGYCLFDTKTTDFCATKQACGRDLVAEYVEAARAEGRKVGFYFSMMDWFHPDGLRCAVDEAARRRFIPYIHEQVHEICSNYGPIDVLWWDGTWPLDPKGWETEKLHESIRKLQPNMVINDRGGLPGDFATSEQKIEPAEVGRPWEACMTINGSWGYVAADDTWKTPKAVLGNLINCSKGGGNFLLNIGPRSDGSVPEPSVRVLEEVGRWMDVHGATIYGSERCRVQRSNYVNFTRKGNTLFLHVSRWPGPVITLARFTSKIKSARWQATGKPVAFEQAKENDPREPDLGFPLYRVKFTGLPEKAPELLPVIAVEFESEPVQDLKFPRWQKKEG